MSPQTVFILAGVGLVVFLIGALIFDKWYFKELDDGQD